MRHRHRRTPTRLAANSIRARNREAAEASPERGVPREGYVVTDAGGTEIGVVVTGLYAPTVDKYCGHAFVDPAHAKVGTPLHIIIRDRPKAAVVARRPFYKPSYR